MIGSVVTRLVPDEGPPVNITGFEGLTRDEQRVLVASSVTFLAGIMQVKGTKHTGLQLSFKLTCTRYFRHSVVIISWTEPYDFNYSHGIKGLKIIYTLDQVC